MCIFLSDLSLGLGNRFLTNTNINCKDNGGCRGLEPEIYWSSNPIIVEFLYIVKLILITTHYQK